MKYRIVVSKKAKKVIEKWKKSHPQLLHKLDIIAHELECHPRTGTGHPEALKGGEDITFSRRISANNRIIYDIYDEEVYVLIIQLEGHYDDK